MRISPSGFIIKSILECPITKFNWSSYSFHCSSINLDISLSSYLSLLEWVTFIAFVLSFVSGISSIISEIIEPFDFIVSFPIDYNLVPVSAI